jgi:hypothetical protein
MISAIYGHADTFPLQTTSRSGEQSWRTSEHGPWLDLVD